MGINMSFTTKIRTGAAALLVFAALPTIVAAIEDDMVIANANTHNIPLFSGGVGEDEMDYIKSIQHQYDIKFLFTANTGEYLSDMHVSITNKSGEMVVNTVTSGPVLLINLPSGTYNVQASEGGVTHEQKIAVKNGSLHTYQLRFPAPEISSQND